MERLLPGAFSKGQVLFGNRGAPIKESGHGGVCGICSGDILVCEAIKDGIA